MLLLWTMRRRMIAEALDVYSLSCFYFTTRDDKKSFIIIGSTVMLLYKYFSILFSTVNVVIVSLNLKNQWSSRKKIVANIFYRMVIPVVSIVPPVTCFVRHKTHIACFVLLYLFVSFEEWCGCTTCAKKSLPCLSWQAQWWWLVWSKLVLKPETCEWASLNDWARHFCPFSLSVLVIE